MALQDIRAFLEDLLLRYDPDIDLSDGSRAQTDLIDPILTRIGPDPFDEDIEVFIRERIAQVFPDLAISEADELTDVVIDPMRVLLEPIVREVKLIKHRANLSNIETLSDDEVDSLLGNFFASRQSGGYAVGVVRIYFATPQSISLTLANPATTRTGLRFLPTRPQQITADQMLLNVEGSEYYFDVNYTAENRGDEYNVGPDEIKSVGNLPSAARVTNPRRFRGGAPRETSLDFAARVENSQSDKTLTVQRGILRTLFEAFPDLRTMMVVGYRDPEMKRDIIRGGSLGPILDADAFGNAYGYGSAVDDLDGDLITHQISSATGHFVSRIGAAGSEPENFYVTLVYADASVIVEDAKVLKVIDDDNILVDADIPVSSPPLVVYWAIRQKKLTLTDIPGGIVFPDSADGTLEITEDEVHIGGKTDVYVAGATDETTAQIMSLTDESPVAQGTNAETDSLTDLVSLNDLGVSAEELTPGMSLVLEEGVDAGAYRILEVLPGSPDRVRIDTTPTGTQADLAWRVVNDIDTELTDPKEIKVTGADLVTIAGNPTVTTGSSVNFLDANVLPDDILEIEDEIAGGDYTITAVNAVTIEVDPAPPRTLGAAAFRVFRRSEAVSPPLVRVSSLELLDSAGAPVGTTIPYRDPVLSLSRAFQNEGTGYVFDGLCTTGLVSAGFTGNLSVGSQTIEWEVYDSDAIWEGTLHNGTFTFSAGAKPVSDVVDEINADASLDTADVKAVELTYGGYSFVGIICPNHVRFVGGTALSFMGITAGRTNAHIRSIVSSGASSLADAQVRAGDLIEVGEGPNAGVTGRVIVSPTSSFDLALIGSGPIGPAGTSGLYNNLVLRPSAGVRVRIGRAPVGSVRVYFLEPTSAEFDYTSTRFTVSGEDQDLVYRPDPENTRVMIPAPPLTELPSSGVTASGPPSTLTDTNANFLLLGVRSGDLLDILYRPIDGTSALPSSSNVAVGGETLILRLDSDPYITISFPFDMLRQDVVDYINEQVGEEIASLNSGILRLASSRRIEIDTTNSTALATLFLDTAPSNSDHPDRGTYIIQDVSKTILSLSLETPLTSATSDTFYRVRRYVQRISSTEMNENQDATELYYTDVEAVAVAPGDQYNIGTGVAMEVEGHRADGYRLVTENPTTSYSRAEVLRAQISRTILLVGSSDSPEEYVQLSRQNVQVTYDRSQLVDEVQSLVDSDNERVVCNEILVRHLLPHYIRLNWKYLGGSAEPAMRRALEEELDRLEPGIELETDDLTDVLRRRGAVSVYTPDPESTSGRTAPLFIVLYHDEERKIRGLVVTDVVESVRTQRFIPDVLTLSRVSPGGIR